jgi:hypothetical protein
MDGHAFDRVIEVGYRGTMEALERQNAPTLAWHLAVSLIDQRGTVAYLFRTSRAYVGSVQNSLFATTVATAAAAASSRRSPFWALAVRGSPIAP